MRKAPSLNAFLNAGPRWLAACRRWRYSRPWEGSWGLAALNVLFPPRCVLCGVDLLDWAGALLLCGDCQTLLAPVIWPVCAKCGSPRKHQKGGCPGSCVNENGTVPIVQKAVAEDCGACRDAGLKFDAVVPLGPYEGRLRESILRTKRVGHDPLTTALAGLMTIRRPDQLAALQADLIVPIPMFWVRRLQRGTNSPEIVAECLGKSLSIPVRRRWLVRCRNTRPQVDLPPRQRRLNVRGAFRVRRAARLQGARVLLVDDILTTGATCSEAAKTLRDAGAACVAVAVLARAQGTIP